MLYVITITIVIFAIHTDEILNQLISHCGPMDGGNECAPFYSCPLYSGVRQRVTTEKCFI